MSESQLNEFQLNSLGYSVAEIVVEFYQNPENLQKFEDWYLKTYGVPYSAAKKECG